MRRANNGELWLDENGKLIGVNLGADYCAEHEWGIRKLQDKLGIALNAPNSKDFQTNSSVRKALSKSKAKDFTFGLENRRITNNSIKLHNNLDTIGAKYNGTNLFGIAIRAYEFQNDKPFEFKGIRDGWFDKERHQFLGFWGDSDFCFLSQNKEYVKDLVKAYEEKDLSLYLAGGGPFKNSGLVLAIMSRLPKENFDQAEEADSKYYELVKSAIATGIYDVIEKSDKSFYALSPRIDKDGSIIFWLNPQDQGIYKSGWYTVDELIQWTNDAGPIIKVKEKI